MAHYTKADLEARAKQFEPVLFKHPDPLWEPARQAVRAKVAALLKMDGHTVEGFDEEQD